MTRILVKESRIRRPAEPQTAPLLSWLASLLLLLVGPDARARTTNFFEGFETGLTNWVAGDANPDGVAAYWGRVDSAFGGEGAQAGGFKVYCAATGFADTASSPDYRSDMLAYLSRTIDLSGYTNGTLTFWYKIPTIEPDDFDVVRVLMNQMVLWSSGQQQGSWRLVTLSLEPFIGQTNTLTFQFQSDHTVTREGCYLDSITVTDAYSPAPPPSQDKFSSGQSLPGSIGTVTATTRGATAESGEPDPGNSIWFRWLAYTNGLVTFRTGGSAIDTLLCVYTGNTLSSLSRVACDDNGDINGASLISFVASAGTLYRISVRGASGAAGFVQLSWEQPDGVGPELLPDLTVWASAQDNYFYGWYLDQSEATAPGRTLLRVSTATPNTGTGPLELRGTSITPGVTQRILRADGSWYDRDAGVFTFHPGHGHLHFDNWLKLQLRSVLADNGVGEVVVSGQKTSFAIIDLRTNSVALPGAPASAQYQGGLVQGLSVGWVDVYDAGLQDQWVDVTDVPSGRYWLEGIVDPDNNLRESNESNNATRILIDYIQPSNAPLNDPFANAFPITGVSASFLGHNTNATLEAGEPRHNPDNPGGRSVWWRWTAPAAITALITTDGSGVDTLLAVYRGTTLNNLVRVAYDDDNGVGSASRVSFQAAAGTNYFVAVDGYNGETGPATGPIQLHLNSDWNDFFANSLVLADIAGSVLGRNVEATRQTGEPTHAAVAGSHSVWYSWTASRDGPMTLDTIGSGFDTLLAVYRGTAVNALTPVASDNNSGGNGTSRLTFNAVSNVTYRIVVDSPGTASGLFRLNWLGPTAPRILTAPASTNVVSGASAFFNVNAIGTAPMGFQWQHAGTNLLNSPYVEGASEPTLRVVKTLPRDAGIYSIVITNAFGSVTSAPGNLIVLDNPRVVYLSETEAPMGGVAVVPIHAQVVGNENSFQFSLQFDPGVLSNPQVLKGDDLGTAGLAVDDSQLVSGRLGAALSLPTGRMIVPGPQRELARVLFDVSPAGVPGSLSAVGFVDSPLVRSVGNTNGAALTTLFVAGSVELHSVTNRISVEHLPDGSYHLSLQGLAGREYAIEASPDLQTWEALTTARAELDGSLQFTDPGLPVLPQRFYRATLLP